MSTFFATWHEVNWSRLRFRRLLRNRAGSYKASTVKQHPHTHWHWHELYFSSKICLIISNLLLGKAGNCSFSTLYFHFLFLFPGNPWILDRLHIFHSFYASWEHSKIHRLLTKLGHRSNGLCLLSESLCFDGPHSENPLRVHWMAWSIDWIRQRTPREGEKRQNAIIFPLVPGWKWERVLVFHSVAFLIQH